ncbi:MAG: glycoside hydrolase family 32 protein [Flavihumibacter sp.]
MRNILTMGRSALLLAFAMLFFSGISSAQSDSGERYRPLLHFTPARGWMNDPNGLVFNNGIYHLFYQYYPDSSKWGPMHWGHATSPDLLHWTHRPIALYPDSLGYIFSGSAVVDKNNTSGFGTGGIQPLVAIYTYHDAKAAKAGKIDHQTQGIAYSLDNGVRWTKYAGNPVLKNPGIDDFRDPKVSWFAPGKKWVMALAVDDHIEFYSSPDLKRWEKESSFGENLGAHGGVWECPDLFPLTINGKEYWVLIVNINPGGPNGGSATQYFVGSFNGKTFRPNDAEIRWLDDGPDNYAGVTFSNTGGRRLFIGWMSNWAYGQEVPTYRWRSATTLPRELSLRMVNGKALVSSLPSAEVKKLEASAKSGNGSATFSKALAENRDSLLRIDLTIPAKDFSMAFSNDQGKQLVWGFDAATNRLYIDRHASGDTGFHPDFGKTSYAARKTTAGEIRITCIVDRSGMELFADDGLTVMTAIYFPGKAFSKAAVLSGAITGKWSLSRLKPVTVK